MSTEHSPDQERPPYQPSINVNKLGNFIDGWADIVEGMGAKAGEVRKDVLEQLKAREMPDIRVGNRPGYVSWLSTERRAYVTAATDPGAVTIIYIAEHGKDLFVSWRTWIEQVLNRSLLLVIGGICLFLGFFFGGIRSYSGGYGPVRQFFSFIGWIGTTVEFAFLAAIFMGMVGLAKKGSLLAYLFIEPSVFDTEDIAAMSLSVHYSMLRALDKVGIDTSKLRLKQVFKAGRKGEEV